MTCFPIFQVKTEVAQVLEMMREYLMKTGHDYNDLVRNSSGLSHGFGISNGGTSWQDHWQGEERLFLLFSKRCHNRLSKRVHSKKTN